jgi:hypothetical protein
MTHAMQEVKDRIIADGMLPMDNPSIAELQDLPVTLRSPQ